MVTVGEAIARLEALSRSEKWISENCNDAPMIRERSTKNVMALEMGINAIKLIDKR